MTTDEHICMLFNGKQALADYTLVGGKIAMIPRYGTNASLAVTESMLCSIGHLVVALV